MGRSERKPMRALLRAACAYSDGATSPPRTAMTNERRSNLFDPDVRRLDDLRVSILLALEETAHLLERGRRGIEPHLHHLLAHVGRLHDLVHLRGDALQH